MDITIYYEDTDSTGIVYHANYLKYCDRARSKYFFENNITLENTNGHLTIHSLECKYVAPAKLGDKLIVQSTITMLKKTSIEIKHIILFENKLIFQMSIKMLYVVNMKPYIFPDQMLKMFKLILKDSE